MTGGSLPTYVEFILLENLIEYVCRHLVIGYSKVAICNEFGRRSME